MDLYLLQLSQILFISVSMFFQQISGVPAQTVQVTTENSTNSVQMNVGSTVQSPEQRNSSPLRRRQQMLPRRAAARTRARQQNLMAVAQNNQNQVCTNIS